MRGCTLGFVMNTVMSTISKCYHLLVVRIFGGFEVTNV